MNNIELHFGKVTFSKDQIEVLHQIINRTEDEYKKKVLEFEKEFKYMEFTYQLIIKNAIKKHFGEFKQ